MVAFLAAALLFGGGGGSFAAGSRVTISVATENYKNEKKHGAHTVQNRERDATKGRWGSFDY
jgi:nitrate/nitrite transporter NarK